MNKRPMCSGVLLFWGLLLSACDGGGNLLTATPAAGTTGTGSTGNNASTTSTVNTPVVRMGVLNSGTFTAGSLAIGTSPLSAGGSSGVRVDIVDTANNNAFVTDEVTVTFSSSCISQGLATMAAVITTTGSASGTYVDQGCGTTDTITARATVGGQALQASGNISVLPSTLGSISFVSATPASISLRGTGDDLSTVIFSVKNASGGPVRNQEVQFGLDTTAGGIRFSDSNATTTTARSDNNGQVSVLVRSGTVTTPVRVRATATVGTNTVVSQSEQLRIETSIADQDSFTIAAQVLNPLGFGCVGTEDIISVRLADRYNNPVKDGTAVSFTTEGGSIEPSCTTVRGSCSVKWVSQNPLPRNYCGAAALAQVEDSYNADCGADNATAFDNGPRPGRSTILATAVGEESFVDSNGNGLFDAGESFVDLEEAFLDKNRNGAFDLDDIFVDFDGDSARDGASGNFTGLLCSGAGCDTRTSLHVRSSLVLAMSAGTPDFDDTRHITTPAGIAYDAANDTFTFTARDITRTVVFLLRDVNRQPLPSGTTVTATITGTGATVVAGASQTDKGSNNDSEAANGYPVAIKGSAATSSVALELKVTTPGCAGGSTQSTSFIFVVNTP